jgi:succinate dehydrogenase hydrophobic anchor subunit
VKTDRATARVVGALFIVGTVAGGLGLALSQPLVDAPEYLTKVSSQEDRVATAALLTLVMGVALVGMSIVIYPVLRRHSNRLALGYVVARTVESVVYVIDAVLLLTLLTVSRGFVDAGASGASDPSATRCSVLATGPARSWMRPRSV